MVFLSIYLLFQHSKLQQTKTDLKKFITQHQNRRVICSLSFIFYFLSVAGPWRQQVLQRKPDLRLQRLLEEPKVFPDQREFIIPQEFWVCSKISSKRDMSGKPTERGPGSILTQDLVLGPGWTLLLRARFPSDLNGAPKFVLLNSIFSKKKKSLGSCASVGNHAGFHESWNSDCVILYYCWNWCAAPHQWNWYNLIWRFVTCAAMEWSHAY